MAHMRRPLLNLPMRSGPTRWHERWSAWRHASPTPYPIRPRLGRLRLPSAFMCRLDYDKHPQLAVNATISRATLTDSLGGVEAAKLAGPTTHSLAIGAA